MKVNLHFQTKIDLEFLSKGVHLRLIRLLGTVHLKTTEGWTPEARIIIDTGNPISIIPHSIWSEAIVNILIREKTKLYGLGTDEASALGGHLAEATIAFKDRKKTSPPVKLKAHLLDNDSAPFIIGFEDVLTIAKLVCNYKSQTAWLEF